MSRRDSRPNATGRSSGKVGGRKGNMLKPPQGEPWVWTTADLLTALSRLSINARRFVDFLQLDHMAHAGTENGNLMATYKQLKAFGLSHRCIAGAISEAEASGLVACNRHGMRVASTYRLTWLPDKYWNPATNDWRRSQNQKSAPISESSEPPQVNADRANLPPQVNADAAPTSERPSIFTRGGGKAASTPQNTHFEQPCSKSALGDPRFSGVVAIKGIEYMELFDRAMARRSANAA